MILFSRLLVGGFTSRRIVLGLEKNGPFFFFIVSLVAVVALVSKFVAMRLLT
jgi:hypothetical protein